MEFKLTPAQILTIALPLKTPGVLVMGHMTCAAHHNSRTLLRAMGIVTDTRKGMLNRKSGYHSYLEAATRGITVRFDKQTVEAVSVDSLRVGTAIAVFGPESGAACNCYGNVLVTPFTARGLVLPRAAQVFTDIGWLRRDHLFFVTGAFNSPLTSLNNVRIGARLNFFKEGIEYISYVIRRNHSSVTIEGGVTIAETDLADTSVFVIGHKK